MEDNYTPFVELDSIYAEIGGYNVLTELSNDDEKVQRYVEVEVAEHHYDLHLAPSKDKGHKTKEEADIYFRDLIGKLQMELDRRGRYQEAQGLTSLYADDISDDDPVATQSHERISEKQYTMSIRNRRNERLIELGLNKTNANKLAIAIEKLCKLMYGGGYDIEGGGSVCD